MKKGIIDVINERLKYNNLSPEEKIEYIKYKYNLNHGQSKSKKKKKGGKK